LGIVFPREKWPQVRARKEFETPGVYILIGYGETDDDLPSVYIGEADGIRNRIESHSTDKDKDFWSLGIAFASTNQGLNKAHVQWLEYALVKRAKEVKQCKLENGNILQEPALTESDRADTEAFLQEIYQILPLVDVRVFQTPKVIATPKTQSSSDTAFPNAAEPDDVDTIIVPARPDGFKEVFLGENRWRAVRISFGKLKKIRWIAGYQTAPVSAITHIAPVDHIEPYGDEKKYQLIFSEPAKEIPKIPGDVQGGMQGPRYTSRSRLLQAKKLSDL
jgi:hypothetical protein